MWYLRLIIIYVWWKIKNNSRPSAIFQTKLIIFRHLTVVVLSPYLAISFFIPYLNSVVFGLYITVASMTAVQLEEELEQLKQSHANITSELEKNKKLLSMQQTISDQYKKEVRMYICTYRDPYTHVRTHTYIYTQTYTQVHTYVGLCAYLCICVYTCIKYAIVCVL